MAETTRPARARRTTATKATGKAATTPANDTTDTPAEMPVREGADNSITFEIPFATDTKTYAKFTVPDSEKGRIAGSLYLPLGTKRVLVKAYIDPSTDDQK